MLIDTLILGGGSAGCVLAARLSEHAGKTIMLIEAGRNISASNMPAAIRSQYPGRAYLDTRNLWARLSARMGMKAPSRRYEQGRVLGGGSAINAMMANRGAPADYDEWEALGAKGWNWAACLPTFRKLERDVNFDGVLHGTEGPVRIERTRRERLSPFVRAVLRVLDTTGYPNRADQNGPWEDGSYVGSIAISENGERIPTSVCYLTDAVRRRPNLTIKTGAGVDRVLFDGTRAIGARLASGEIVSAREVIVCAGAIHSPAILLRSGIGPKEDLAALGIDVIADRPGVGGNLMEHPSIAVSAFLKKPARTPLPDAHHEQAIVRFSSGLPNTVPGDMHGAILSRSGWHSIGYRLGTIFFWVNKSYSRGRVTLVSSNANDEPKVEFNMLSDTRDLDRLKLAIRFGATTLRQTAAADGAVGTLFPSSYSPRVAKVAVPGAWNAVQRGALSLLLDIAGPWRAMLVRKFVTQGTTLDTLLADDHAMTAFITRSVGGTWHPSGTCRMGAAEDRHAVTDASGRVYGTENLRVCDASLMPSIPCANTNIPTIMIAERIADMIRSEMSDEAYAS